MCRVLKVTPSGYYDFKNRIISLRQQRRLNLMPIIDKIYHRFCKRYGSPRIHQELLSIGYVINRKTVACIMETLCIKALYSKTRKPSTTNSEHDYVIAENILDRNFTAETPNQKWVTDITYVKVAQGWCYLAVVLDLFSRKIVGWATADHMKTDLICEALNMAITHRKPGKNLLHHSDRGSQYASDKYQLLLAQHHMNCSMSRKGNCWDNAVIESFFGTLKTELNIRFMSEQAMHDKLFEYIEVFYNCQRLHSTLNYMSPAAYERKHLAA